MNSPIAARLALVCAGLAIAAPAVAFPISGNLYVQPSSEPFIESSGGSVVTVNDSSGSISTAQTALNNAHTNNPSAVVVLNLTGTYKVSSAALNLTSNTCCVLTSGTIIEAASSSITPTCLIQIHSQSNVSVAGGTFNGEGASVNAIQIETSSRINIDDITVANCDRDGVYLTGNGNSTYDSENTVTRCTISGGTSNGIKAESCTQAVIIDNNCSGNTGAGIYLSGAHCTVTNNTCTSNGTGITVAGSSNFISDNECDTNPTGISMISGSSANVVASNHAYYATTVGINEAASSGDTFFENYYKGNTSNFTSSGSGNYHLAYKSAISDPNDKYFYPPIFSNQHTTTTIVNGLGRYDLTIGATTIASVQSQYNSAVSAHSSDVIVLHLTGTTYTGGNTPLTLGSNTCVLLTGTIQMSGSGSWTSAVTATSGSTNFSFSGGTIDGGGRGGYPAINFNSCGMYWIQGVTVQNFGVPTTRTDDGMIDIHTPTGPAMVSSCTLNEGGGRGIWTEQAGPYVITDNSISNVQMDGIDCDYHTSMALVKFNTCDTNTRCGVFIEQGDTFVHLVANSFSGNSRSGFSVWNNGVSGNEAATEYNTACCNDCVSGGYGFETGSQPGSAYVENIEHNFFFNNSASSNTTGQEDANIGQGSGGSNSVQNYYGQNFVHDNTTDLDLSPGGLEVFFNSSEP